MQNLEVVRRFKAPNLPNHPRVEMWPAVFLESALALVQFPVCSARRARLDCHKPMSGKVLPMVGNLSTHATRRYPGSHSCTYPRSPSSALLPFLFLGEGSPTKIDYRKSGTLTLTSPLDLVPDLG